MNTSFRKLIFRGPPEKLQRLFYDYRNLQGMSVHLTDSQLTVYPRRNKENLGK